MGGKKECKYEAIQGVLLWGRCWIPESLKWEAKDMLSGGKVYVLEDDIAEL